jgi:enoyl-CoA hydratase
MSDAVRVEVVRGIPRLTLDHGANALDPALMKALSDALSHWEGHGAPPLLLASAHPTLFSPGWDLKRLADADRGQVAEFLRLFNALVVQLFSYPAPTAAAVEGHAVAGGCLLCVACDVRVMARGQARMGLSEVNLGVPIPASSVRMLAARLTPSAAEEVMFGGDGCTAERALELGLVTRTSASGSAASDADAVLRGLAAKPARAYAETKRFLHRAAWAGMVTDAEEDSAFLDAWFDPTTRARVLSVVHSLGR